MLSSLSRIVLLGWIAVVARAAEIPLRADPELWQHKVLSLGNVQEKDAVTFSLTTAGLSIGPWVAGQTSARLEYSQPIPILRGMILGRYHTEAMHPRQAAVRLQFNQASHSLAVRIFPLAASAAGWSEIAIPVFRPPQGADSITVGFGLGEKTEGHVQFTDLRVSDKYHAPEFLGDAPTLTRPAPPATAKPAPMVHLVNAGSAWWLASPQGKPFFSLGSATYSHDEPLVFEQMRHLFFNSLAGGHDLKRWAAFNDRQMAANAPVAFQFRIVGTDVGGDYDTLLDASGTDPRERQAKAAKTGGFDHAFPDPFDPRWQESVQKRVHEIAVVVKDKPYFAGWFADNERSHRDLHRFVWSPHCSTEFRRYLEKRYGTIAALNRAWGTKFESFDALMREKPDPVVRKGAMYEEFRAFSREIIRHFNQTLLNAIHAEDPGRLVFSNRFMVGEIRDVLDNLDLYEGFDGIAINVYPANITAGIDPSERQYIEMVHARTGKPILITEWSVPALDSGLYDRPAHLDWSYPQAMETQALRARQAAQYEADLYNMPYVVGAHWFTWNDFDTPVRQANRGLFKVDKQPWTELQDALRSINARMAQP